MRLHESALRAPASSPNKISPAKQVMDGRRASDGVDSSRQMCRASVQPAERGIIEYCKPTTKSKSPREHTARDTIRFGMAAHGDDDRDDADQSPFFSAESRAISSRYARLM